MGPIKGIISTHLARADPASRGAAGSTGLGLPAHRQFEITCRLTRSSPSTIRPPGETVSGRRRAAGRNQTASRQLTMASEVVWLQAEVE